MESAETELRPAPCQAVLVSRRHCLHCRAILTDPETSLRERNHTLPTFPLWAEAAASLLEDREAPDQTQVPAQAYPVPAAAAQVESLAPAAASATVSRKPTRTC